MVTVAEVKFGRVTIYDDTRQPAFGFDHKLAWTVVYRTAVGNGSCPGKSPPVVRNPPPGTFDNTQIFVVDDGGTAVQYSQPASWFCGEPTKPTVLPISQRISVPWHPGDSPGEVTAAVPDCIRQPVDPLPVPRTESGHPVLAVYAFGPFPPAHCSSTSPRKVSTSAGVLGHAPTVPVDCTQLAGQASAYIAPDGCALDSSS
jgi:hypothetical protein